MPYKPSTGAKGSLTPGKPLDRAMRRHAEDAARKTVQQSSPVQTQVPTEAFTEMGRYRKYKEWQNVRGYRFLQTKLIDDDQYPDLSATFHYDFKLFVDGEFPSNSPDEVPQPSAPYYSLGAMIVGVYPFEVDISGPSPNLYAKVPEGFDLDPTGDDQEYHTKLFRPGTGVDEWRINPDHKVFGRYEGESIQMTGIFRRRVPQLTIYFAHHPLQGKHKVSLLVNVITTNVKH